MKGRYKSIFLWSLRPAIIFLVSCSPVKGYSGTTLPNTDLTRFTFRSLKGVSFEYVTVNDHSVSLFRPGIEVRPGNQKLEAGFILNDPDCPLLSGICRPRYQCNLQFETKAGESYTLEALNGGAYLFSNENPNQPVQQAHCIQTNRINWPDTKID